MPNKTKTCYINFFATFSRTKHTLSQDCNFTAMIARLVVTYCLRSTHNSQGLAFSTGTKNFPSAQKDTLLRLAAGNPLPFAALQNSLQPALPRPMPSKASTQFSAKGRAPKGRRSVCLKLSVGNFVAKDGAPAPAGCSELFLILKPCLEHRTFRD